MGLPNIPEPWLIETYECDGTAKLNADGKLYITLPDGSNSPVAFNPTIIWENYETKEVLGTGKELILKDIQMPPPAALAVGFKPLLKVQAKIDFGDGNYTYSRVATVKILPCPIKVITNIEIRESNGIYGLTFKTAKIVWKESNPTANEGYSKKISVTECYDSEWLENQEITDLSIQSQSNSMHLKSTKVVSVLNAHERLITSNVGNMQLQEWVPFDDGLRDDISIGNKFSFTTSPITLIDGTDGDYNKKLEYAQLYGLPFLHKKGNIKIGITDGNQKKDSIPYTKSRDDVLTVLTDNIILNTNLNSPLAGLNFEVYEIAGFNIQEEEKEEFVLLLANSENCRAAYTT